MRAVGAGLLGCLLLVGGAAHAQDEPRLSLIADAALGAVEVELSPTPVFGDDRDQATPPAGVLEGWRVGRSALAVGDPAAAAALVAELGTDLPPTVTALDPGSEAYWENSPLVSAIWIEPPEDLLGCGSGEFVELAVVSSVAGLPTFDGGVSAPMFLDGATEASTLVCDDGVQRGAYVRPSGGFANPHPKFTVRLGDAASPPAYLIVVERNEPVRLVISGADPSDPTTAWAAETAPIPAPVPGDPDEGTGAEQQAWLAQLFSAAPAPTSAPPVSATGAATSADQPVPAETATAAGAPAGADGGGFSPWILIVPLTVAGATVGYLAYRRREDGATDVSFSSTDSVVHHEPTLRHDAVLSSGDAQPRLPWPDQHILQVPDRGAVTLEDEQLWNRIVMSWIERAALLAMEAGHQPNSARELPVPAWAWERAWIGIDPDQAPQVRYEDGTIGSLTDGWFDPRTFLLGEIDEVTGASDPGTGLRRWATHDPEDTSMVVDLETFVVDHRPLVPDGFRAGLRESFVTGEGWVPVPSRRVMAALRRVERHDETARTFTDRVEQLAKLADDAAGGSGEGVVEVNPETGEVRDPTAMRIRLPPETREAMMSSAVEQVTVL